MVWLDKNITPLPQSGKIIISVARYWGEPASFTACIKMDGGIPIDSDGDTYIYKDDITHWMPMPQPAFIVLPVVQTYIPG